MRTLGPMTISLGCRLRSSFVLVGAALLLTTSVGCGGDDERASLRGPQGPATTAQSQNALRDLIRAASAPPTPAEQAVSATGEETQIKSENGAVQECVYKRFTGTELYETLVSFDPNADSIWPGAITQTTTLAQGLAAPIALPRRPGTITIGDATIRGGNYSRTVDAPSLASSRQAIGSILGQDGVHLAAKSNYLAETAYSMNEASLKIGVDASWMSGSVKASFQGSWVEKKTTMVVRFIQAYYTVSFEAPASPELVFAETVTADDARPYMGPGNPPAFVSSVTYGRMLVMKVESNDSERDLRAALDVAFNKVNVEIDAASKSVLQNSTFSVFVLGGSPDDAARIQAAGSEDRAAALAAYIQKGASYDPASPGVAISYTMRRLADNETIKVASTIDYQVPVCTPQALNVGLDMKQIAIRKDGKAGGSTTGEYELWVESSDAPGGALPPTPGKEDTSRRVTIAKGTSAIDDGSAIAINAKQFVRVSSQQGAKITLGGHVKSTAKGKQCDVTRTHEYRFNPKTNLGEWTNTGDNTLNCAASDSALLGNNSLDVDLQYAFTP